MLSEERTGLTYVWTREDAGPSAPFTFISEKGCVHLCELFKDDVEGCELQVHEIFHVNTWTQTDSRHQYHDYAYLQSLNLSGYLTLLETW